MSQMIKRLSVLVPVAGLGLVAAAGCSSSGTSPSPSPSGASTPASSNPTHSPSASPAKAVCSKTAIQSVLPKGETLTEYKCADAGVEYWAAGLATKSGQNVNFFLKSEKGKWTTIPSGEVCGTASAGLPPEILGFCAG